MEIMEPITAILIDGGTVEAAGKVRRYKQPIYALARVLIKEGHDPETILVTCWQSGTASFKPAPLWKFAHWSVVDRDRRKMGLEPHRKWPGKVRGATVERDPGLAA